MSKVLHTVNTRNCKFSISLYSI